MCRKLFYLVSFVLMLNIVATGASEAADADIRGLWTLDETSGTTAHDTSGNGNDGTLMGNPQWVTGYIDGALEFNGSSDYVQIPFSESLKVLNQGNFTISAWFMLNEIPGENKEVLQQGDRNGTGRTWLYVHNSNNIQTYLGGAGISSGVSIEGGAWYHAAVVITEGGASDNIQIYVNSEPAGAPVQRGIEDCEGDFFIGCHKNLTNFWDGIIDDVRIYSRVLSETEIRKLVFGPKAYKPIPADGAAVEDTWVNLSWSPGIYAVSHNVYLGVNFDNVNDGAADTFRGNQVTTSFLAGFPGFTFPEGLVPGTTYYWRIDEVNDAEPNSPWKGDIWSFTIPPMKAYNSYPADGTKYIDPNVTLSWQAGMDAKVHYVYFAEKFDDVNNAVGALPVTDTTYTPGTLEPEKTYYWRVDEFDGLVTHKGDVWSFTIMPNIAITEPNLVAWWTLDEGMGDTALDWSGHGNHGTLFGPRWVIPGLIGNAALRPSGGYVAIQNLSYNSTGIAGVTVCAWIRTNSSGTQYIASFDRDSFWRLEINGNGGGPGQVGWDVMTSAGQIDYGSVTRVDNGLWHHVCGVFDMGMMIIYIDGEPEPSTMGGPTFGSGNTRFGFIGANSEATAFNGSRGSGAPVAGEIDDLRIYDKALTAEEIKLAMRGDTTIAWNSSPGNGTTPYIRDAMPLSWSPGDRASQHDVYFGTDQAVVFEADSTDTTGIYRGRQSATIYNPPEGVEWGGGPYYWRVDENNTDGTVSKGSVWSFTVADFLKIEDFEDYNDFEPDRIFDTWSDGWGIAINGSEVGYAEPNFTLGEHHLETTIVHSGFQSLPYFFDNNFKYSEASLPLVSVRNWTEEGVTLLSLWFYGDPSNAAEKMYVSISNASGVTGTVYHDDPAAAQIATWAHWTIELKKFADQGVNLTNVDKFYIGFGDKANLQAGGTGKMYFDDICLKRPVPTP